MVTEEAGREAAAGAARVAGWVEAVVAGWKAQLVAAMEMTRVVDPREGEAVDWAEAAAGEKEVTGVVG